jgi:hypothetical protein
MVHRPSWLACAAAGLVLVAAVAAHADEKRTAAAQGKRTAAGFRLEGDPEIEMVFGDTAGYRKHVDRFYELHGQLRDTRAEFQRFARATQTTLEAHGKKCPADAVAPLYAQAYDRGQRYRELGAQLEGHWAAIDKLDKLGETSGLTPDYRWRVRRGKRLYEAALVDYREIRGTFDDQLGKELAFRKCDVDRLLAEGRAGNLPEADAVSTAATPKPGKSETAPIKLAAATFFIDNQSCSAPLAVYLDGVLLGEVASGARAAFQGQPGRHALCLIPGTSVLRCGDLGTVRSAHIHDGWSMAMKCR